MTKRTLFKQLIQELISDQINEDTFYPINNVGKVIVAALQTLPKVYVNISFRPLSYKNNTGEGYVHADIVNNTGSIDFYIYGPNEIKVKLHNYATKAKVEKKLVSASAAIRVVNNPAEAFKS